MTSRDGEVRVKPLPWEWVPANLRYDGWNAETGLVYYQASHVGERWQAWNYNADVLIGDYPTDVEAKAACQADYEARILSALSIEPPAVGAATEAQAAYALLWRMRTTDKAIHGARKSLLATMSKEEQRAALQWAIDTFGHTEPPTLEELP